MNYVRGFAKQVYHNPGSVPGLDRNTVKQSNSKIQFWKKLGVLSPFFKTQDFLKRSVKKCTIIVSVVVLDISVLFLTSTSGEENMASR